MSQQPEAKHIQAKKLYEIIKPLCRGYTDYALLDFPAHSNVGDSAIYLGELAIFDRIFNKPPRYVCTKKSPANDIDRIMPVGIIFLHGGGNFGDIWPAHQKFFKKILRQYPDRKIVQLPQSIHFSSSDNLLKTSEAIRDHKNFTMLVRDHKSFQIAREHFNCELQLCPDSAFAITGLESNNNDITHNVLCMLRSDKEKHLTTKDWDILARLGKIDDWLHEKQVKTISDRLRELAFIYRPQSRAKLMPKREQMYRRHAQARLDRGIAQINSAKYIVSDRLHVHILSSLLQKPHFVLDNSYNKIGNYISTWPMSESTHVVENIEELEDGIKRLNSV